jgi:hypothetical protein
MFFKKRYSYEELFVGWFGFSPDRLNEVRYQKEALVRLAILARAVKEKARSYARSTGLSLVLFEIEGSDEENYRHAFKRYDSAFALLEHYAPDLAREIPHWSELPAFISAWVEGSPIAKAREARDVEQMPTLETV